MEESPVIQEVRERVRKWIDAGDGRKSLNLSHMDITELPADIFAGCSQLNTIYLHNNKLKKLPANLFAECFELFV